MNAFHEHRLKRLVGLERWAMIHKILGPDARAFFALSDQAFAVLDFMLREPDQFADFLISRIPEPEGLSGELLSALHAYAETKDEAAFTRAMEGR